MRLCATKMKRATIEIIFIISLSIILGILSKEIPIHKVEYIGLDWNLGYKWTLIGIIVLFPVFNYFILKMNYLITIFYSIISGSILFVLAKNLNTFLISYLWRLDNQQTPFGWEFKYRWLDLLFWGLLLVLLSELIGNRINKRNMNI